MENRLIESYIASVLCQTWVTLCCVVVSCFQINVHQYIVGQISALTTWINSRGRLSSSLAVSMLNHLLTRPDQIHPEGRTHPLTSCFPMQTGFWLLNLGGLATLPPTEPTRNMTWRLKVGIVEKEQMIIARQWLGKHNPVATSAQVTIELPFLCKGELGTPLNNKGIVRIAIEDCRIPKT